MHFVFHSTRPCTPEPRLCALTSSKSPTHYFGPWGCQGEPFAYQITLPKYEILDSRPSHGEPDTANTFPLNFLELTGKPWQQGLAEILNERWLQVPWYYFAGVSFGRAGWRERGGPSPSPRLALPNVLRT